MADYVVVGVPQVQTMASLSRRLGRPLTVPETGHIARAGAASTLCGLDTIRTKTFGPCPGGMSLRCPACKRLVSGAL